MPKRKGGKKKRNKSPSNTSSAAAAPGQEDEINTQDTAAQQAVRDAKAKMIPADAKCRGCGKQEGKDVDLSCCSRCMSSWFCSRECQLTAWVDHKAECSRVLDQKAREAVDEHMKQLEECPVCMRPQRYSDNPGEGYRPCCGKIVCEICAKQRKITITNDMIKTFKKIDKSPDDKRHRLRNISLWNQYLSCEFCRGEKVGDGTDNYDAWFSKIVHRNAVERNDPVALFMIAKMYERGTHGNCKDTHKAMEYLQKAVDLGNIGATTWLGLKYREGDDCVQLDEEKAIEYLTVASSHGSTIAHDHLAGIYLGRNDIPLTKQHVQKAAVGGSKVAVSIMKILRKNNDASCDELYLVKLMSDYACDELGIKEYAEVRLDEERQLNEMFELDAAREKANKDKKDLVGLAEEFDADNTSRPNNRFSNGWY